MEQQQHDERFLGLALCKHRDHHWIVNSVHLVPVFTADVKPVPGPTVFRDRWRFTTILFQMDHKYFPWTCVVSITTHTNRIQIVLPWTQELPQIISLLHFSAAWHWEKRRVADKPQTHFVQGTRVSTSIYIVSMCVAGLPTKLAIVDQNPHKSNEPLTGRIVWSLVTGVSWYTNIDKLLFSAAALGYQGDLCCASKWVLTYFPETK